MATIRAISSGNWSATSTWNGGVFPGNGDTVYSNGFTVTIDQNITIGGANNPLVNAGSFIAGQWYEITSVGSTSFTGIGASANTVGIVFLATGAGSGTGQARALATLTTLTNTAAGATTGGGGFTMSSSYNINASIRAGNSVCLTITGATNSTMNAAQIISGTAANAHGISNSSSGNITINSSTFETNAAGAALFHNTNTGQIIVNGSPRITNNANGLFSIINNLNGSIEINNSIIFAGILGTFNQNAISNAASGTITINSSNVSGGGGGSATSYAINNAGSGTININNSTLNAGSGTAGPGFGSNNCINNALTGTVNCNACTFTATNSQFVVASTNANATNRFSGTFISSPNGTQPINATRWILNSGPTASYIQHALDGINANSFVRYYTADNNLGQANPTDVRSGVSYASGNLTGRLTIPARGTVASGVNLGPSMPFTATRSDTTATATLTYSYPYQAGDVITVTGASNNEWNGDYTITEVVSATSVRWTVPTTHSATAGTAATMQTKGTATLDASAVASAVWGAATSSLTTAGSIGERLKNAATVATTGEQLATALTAP